MMHPARPSWARPRPRAPSWVPACPVLGHRCRARGDTVPTAQPSLQAQNSHSASREPPRGLPLRWRTKAPPRPRAPHGPSPTAMTPRPRSLSLSCSLHSPDVVRVQTRLISALRRPTTRAPAAGRPATSIAGDTATQAGPRAPAGATGRLHRGRMPDAPHAATACASPPSSSLRPLDTYVFKHGSQAPQSSKETSGMSLTAHAVDSRTAGTRAGQLPHVATPLAAAGCKGQEAERSPCPACPICKRETATALTSQAAVRIKWHRHDKGQRLSHPLSLPYVPPVRHTDTTSRMSRKHKLHFWQN